MDIGKSIRFVFDDERWITKLLIAVVLSILSVLFIPAFFLIGYMVAVARNVKNGVKNPLPEWDDWGKLFMDGLYIFLAQMVYSLPMLILVCIASIATGGFSAVAEAGADPDALSAMMGTTLFLMTCLLMIYGLVLVFISPAIVIQYILNDNKLGACFRFGEVLGIARANIADILMILLVTLGINLVVGLVVWIPLLGMIVGVFAYPYVMFVSGHLYGQIAVKHFGGGSKEEQFSF